jgi:hypothetical protein
MSITQTTLLVHINHKRNPVIWFISTARAIHLVHVNHTNH